MEFCCNQFIKKIYSDSLKGSVTKKGHVGLYSDIFQSLFVFG